jgi:phospholipase C
VINPSGSEAQKIYPCFEHQTLVDLLDNAGVSWRYYAPSAGSIWTGPNAIQHLRFGSDWNHDVVLKPARVLTDIANGQLANVSWVIPTGQESDHPGAIISGRPGSRQLLTPSAKASIGTTLSSSSHGTTGEDGMTTLPQQ